jgi:DtxR family Mn-dependent transcriptional regulator
MMGHHPAVEQYLETILELEESGIVPLRARIVERLGVSAPAVSETVKRLEREGYVTLDSERVLHLTESGPGLRHVDAAPPPAGRAAARRRPQGAVGAGARGGLPARARHQRQPRGPPRRAARRPGTCPHGAPIPGSANVVDHGPLQALSAVEVGRTCVVRRIDEHLQTMVERLELLERSRLLPGQQVVVLEPQDGDVALDVDGQRVLVEPDVAAEVYVSV